MPSDSLRLFAEPGKSPYSFCRDVGQAGGRHHPPKPLNPNHTNATPTRILSAAPSSPQTGALHKPYSPGTLYTLNPKPNLACSLHCNLSQKLPLKPRSFDSKDLSPNIGALVLGFRGLGFRVY